MRVAVTKTSDSGFKEVREYKDLEECVDTLLQEDFDGFTPELVIFEENYRGCKYTVEIYDSWRE